MRRNINSLAAPIGYVYTEDIRHSVELSCSQTQARTGTQEIQLKYD